MPVARPETSDSRVIAHVDMDCFYVQVEQRKNPELRGLPTAVVQYNSWQGGGLIAVSYEARKYGVKRSMRGAESKQVCPQIQLVQVPVARGKADLNPYQNAGSEVVSILSGKGRCERASIDEVYLDLTDAAETMLAEAPPESLEEIEEEALKSHVLGLDNEDGCEAKENVRKWLCKITADRRDKLLACGALIVAKLRLLVLKETEFTCSAGIAHNKMLAKLASGMNKPAKQTVVPLSSVKGLLESLPIKKMKQLGGKLGSSLQTDMGVNTVGDLLQFSEEKLQQRYGINTGTWLWNIARGISGEEVEGRLLPKSHGSGKTFPGPQALKMISSVQHWLNELCEDLSERLQLDLDENKRIAHTLVLHANAYKASDSDSQKKFPSKSCPLRYGAAKIQEVALNLFQAALREYLGLFTAKIQGSQNNQWGITSLSVSASKIVPIPSNPCCFLKNQAQDEFMQESLPLPTSGSEHFSGVNQSQLMKNSSGEDPSVKLAMPGFRRLEQKRKTVKNKGTSSILRFFKNQDPSSSPKKLEHVENTEDAKALLSVEPYNTVLFLMKRFRSLSAMPSTRDCCELSGHSHNLNLRKKPAVSDAVRALPFDIITEILSWLPVDSLLRFKCVCKKWRSLLLDYNFIAKHMVRARPLQLSYKKEWNPYNYDTVLYDENFKHISDVAGLLLEESLTSRVFRIRNFATHQVLYLPDAHGKSRSMGLFFDSSTGECKAACFHWKQEGDSGFEVAFEVLSIGKDDRWRTLKLPKQNGEPYVGRYFTAAKEEGAAHLVEIIRDGQDFKLEVQSLDIWSERFTIATLPRGAFLDLKRVTIFLWNYYVAVADIVEESLNVLVLEDFKEHKWRKIIVPLKFLKDNPGLKDEICPQGVWLNDLQLHNGMRKYILVYDMERKVIKATHTKSVEKIYEFRKPSLVTLKGMKNEY